MLGSDREAFMMQVVPEVEQEGLACDHVRRKYGIRATGDGAELGAQIWNGSWGKGYERKHLKK